MGNDGLSSKQVGSQASRRVTRRLAWIQTVCISINAVPALKGSTYSPLSITVVPYANSLNLDETPINLPSNPGPNYLRLFSAFSQTLKIEADNNSFGGLMVKRTLIHSPLTKSVYYRPGRAPLGGFLEAPLWLSRSVRPETLYSGCLGTLHTLMWHSQGKNTMYS